MGDLWMPGAVKDGRAWTNYSMNGAGGSVRVALHTTENAQSGSPKGVANYLWNQGAGMGYNMIYHPTTGEFLQLRPFNVGAGSLKNLSGGVETNKNGKYNFQISIVAYASEAWWNYPMPGWGNFIAWIHSWGVPDRYVQYTFSQNTRMSTGTWTGSSSGWYGHRHAPENDHTDPGGVPDPWSLKGGDGSGTGGGGSAWESYDSNGNFHRNLYLKSPGRNGADVEWVQQKVGVSADGLFGNDTDKAVRSWQSANGLTSDGNVGPATAAAMGMPGAGGSTPPPPTSSFPLPSGHWYGQKSSNSKNHSGYAPGVSSWPDPYTVDQSNIKKIQSAVGVKADGLFGPKTESAVKSYQSSHGLAADGDVGVKTWESLF